MIDISVVIPTRNRKERLLSLLNDLSQSTYPILEVIIVDSSDFPLHPEDYARFHQLKIVYQTSEPSVCIQRNIGIRLASSEWIFLCDDDIEVPADYLQKIASHIDKHEEAGAVSGMVLQQEAGSWTSQYRISSARELILKYLFRLGVWGQIDCPTDNIITRRLVHYYKKHGNHISKAGWPVITEFNNTYFTVPVYGLGASVVRKSWLLASPYDEVLDPHGIGDNYGVAMGFPPEGIHLLRDASVFHHQARESRLDKPQQYYRRMLALDYFIRKGKTQAQVRRSSFLKSLLGNAIIFTLSGDRLMRKPAFKTFWRLLTATNPYLDGSGKGLKKVAPAL